MAVGAARPAVHHRKPAGGRRQYRHRGGRARSPRRIHALLAATTNTVNATLYEKLNFDFIRDIAPVAAIARAPNGVGLNPSVPVKTAPASIAYHKTHPAKP